MFKNTPKTFYMGGATPTDMTMINRGVFFMNGADATSTDWKDKPADWSDIRLDCPANSIALYAGVKSDYSAYDNLGFTATCTGGYNVFIDGTQYGTTYASGTQCSITWSEYTATAGEAITTPSALTAHKIWIEPATAGNNITAFKMQRVAANGSEAQGVLWEHFNLTNSICINALNATGSLAPSDYYNPLLMACTAKNNILNFLPDDYNCKRVFLKCEILEYLPQLNCDYSGVIDATFFFANCYKVKKIDLRNMKLIGGIYMFLNCRALKNLPNLDYQSALSMNYHITNDTALQDTIIDVRSSTNLRTIGAFGSAQYFMGGLKGLRVSSSAPFSNGTSPQINVSYTGMDRTALVQLFNDLPTVSAGQIINVTGATGSEDLTGADILIATNKGWTIAGGPTPVQLYAYTDGNNNTIYAKDENLVGTYKSLNTNDFDNFDSAISNSGIASFDTGHTIQSKTGLFGTGYKDWTMVLTLGNQDFLSWTPFFAFEDSNSPFFIGRWVDVGRTRLLSYDNSWSSEAWADEVPRDNSGFLTFIIKGSDTNTWFENHHQEGLAWNTGEPANFTGSKIYFGDNQFELDLTSSYFIVNGVKTTLAIFDTTSQLYNSSFQKITATAENYNDVIVINGTTYTRDTTKDTTAVVPD